MHIVFVTFHFPPSAAVGAQRPAKMVDALLNAGHTVTVVARAEPGAATHERQFGGRLTVCRVVPWRGSADFYLRAKALAAIRRRSTSKPQIHAPWTRAPTRGAEGSSPWWRRFVRSLTVLPDADRGFILPAIRAGRAAIHDGASVLVTTAPPWSVHIVGLLLKSMTHVRWIADYRDPWTGSVTDPKVRDLVKPRSMRTSLTDAFEAWLERQCLCSADRIVCATYGIAAFTAAKISMTGQAKTRVVLNGIDAPGPASWPKPAGDRLKIVHAGNCYVGRDPLPFLEALAALRSGDESRARDVDVDFIGACRTFKGRDVAAEAAERGLGSVVRFSDWLPKVEADKAVRQADLLLLLAQDQPICVPNKLYDYLSTGRPILAFTSGETAAMLARAGGHSVVTTDDPDDAVRALASALLRARTGGFAGDRSVLTAWSTLAQMDAFVAMVEQLN